MGPTERDDLGTPATVNGGRRRGSVCKRSGGGVWTAALSSNVGHVYAGDAVRIRAGLGGAFIFCER